MPPPTSAIDLRRNLIARGKRVCLVFSESDTKNAEPIDFELPAMTVDVVAWYIREYRPHLVRHETDALFPGQGNGPKSAYGFGAQIKAAVFRFSGLVVNPHLVRHAGAKMFLDQRPGEYEVMRQVLISPAAHGLSQGRWNNVRSLLGKALAMARPMLPGRSIEPLMPEWGALAAALPFNRRVRVLPMLRYLSTCSIGPSQVTLADLEKYKDAIISDRLRKDPEKTWDSLLWSWNSCCRDIEAWPAIVIERAIKREVYVQPWPAFPASLKEDVDGYLQRLAGTDLSEHGPPRPARPATLQRREYQFRMAASALVHIGVEPKDLRTIGDLLSFERYQMILRFFLDRHGGQTSPQVGQLAGFLKDVAKHWLNVNDATLDRFRKIASRLAMPRAGMTPKNRDRLRPFDDPKVVAVFLELPHRIRRDVQADKWHPRKKAIFAEMAASIAILQAAPIRIKNLAELDFRRHLIERGRQLYLIIPEAEVKNGEPIEFELPAETVDIVAWYVREHRPVLLTEPTDALFPRKNGQAKSPAALGTQISSMMFKYTGLKINPHLFRHIAGKLFLDARPGQYEVVRRVLGHRSIATTTSIYTGAEARAAGQHFAAVIAERRRALQNGRRTGASTPRRRGDPA
jgi:site-specific recombinase XerD